MANIPWANALDPLSSRLPDRVLRSYRRFAEDAIDSPGGGMERLKVGVLISGRGSNLQALIDAASDPAYPAEIALVISNRADAGGLAYAEAAGIPARVIAETDRSAFAAAAEHALRGAEIGLVALAGFMRLLDTGFVAAWRDRLVNIHPSLLPAFPGLHPQRQALAAGVKFSGCTVHFVRAEVDTGPIVAQAVVPVEDGDDETRLADRILAAEHRLYPLAVRLFAEGRLRNDGNRVAIAGALAPELALLNPSEALT
jgi:phosphoribosylglycinamide formyltransferase-1